MVTSGGAFVLLPKHHELLLTLPQPSGRKSYRRKCLTRSEALTVEAVTTRILPSDATPGAKEAQVVYFVDHLLSTAYATQQSAYRNGVRRLNEVSRARYKRIFVRLSAAEQDALLGQMERGELGEWQDAAGFFAMIRGHTIEGMFADPKYHGNLNGVGWKLMGAEEHK